MKIIYILPYSSFVTGRNFKVDVFGDGFHVTTARQVWKRTKKYQLECWRPERKLKRAIMGEKDGIVYRAFPSFRPTLGFLDRYIWNTALATIPSSRIAFGKEYSLSMLRELRKVCQKEEVLLHIISCTGDLTHLIYLNCRNVPIVAIHGGGAPQTYSVSNFIYHLPFSLIERKAVSYADIAIASSKWIYDRLSKLFSSVTLFFPWGIDFEEFKPIAKEKARNILGIPSHKKVLLYVGQFDSVKGVGLALEAYQELRNSHDLEFLMVGGLKTDPLYRKAVESGAIVRERVPQTELISYYSAADIYLFPKFYTRGYVESVDGFAGMGIAPIESLACGTPIVGTNLKHFLGNEEELRGVGRIPTDPEDVAQCVSEVLEHPDVYRNCREIARRYYSQEVVADHLVDIYDELFDKYYK